MTSTEALLLIDIQYDFLPGGALGVAEGDQIIEPILGLAHQFSIKIASQDWHPTGHFSFASSHPGKDVFDLIPFHNSQQTLWPDHCIQGSHGANIHQDILELGLTGIFQKGTNPEIDSYSAFFDNQRLQKTGLDAWLKSKEISQLTLAGLATDYCVKHSVLDALELGYSVRVFLPGTRGVNIQPDDSQKAIDEMKIAGAHIFR